VSVKSLLILAVLFFSALGTAYFLQVKMGGEVYSQRNPSSDEEIHLHALKEQVLKPKKGASVIHTEKLRGPLEIHLSNADKNGPSASGQITLNLQITSDRDLPHVRVRWVLPPGVQYLGGSGSFDGHKFVEEEISVNRDVVVEKQIYLQLLDDLNRQIHVQVSSEQTGMQFTEVAQYNTLFEPYLNDGAKMESLQKSSVEDVKPDVKVFE
tara:strand:+ start:2397 stop:3026 length:630 start_codon:yes stop_codon:yes gene_type:complete